MATVMIPLTTSSGIGTGRNITRPVKSYHIDLTIREADFVDSCFTYAAVQSHIIPDENC